MRSGDGFPRLPISVEEVPTQFASNPLAAPLPSSGARICALQLMSQRMVVPSMSNVLWTSSPTRSARTILRTLKATPVLG
jgi:hypothetical protein